MPRPWAITNSTTALISDEIAGWCEFPRGVGQCGQGMGSDPPKDTTLIKPYVILDTEITDGAGETHHIKDRADRLCAAPIMNWDRRHLEGNVQTRDILETAGLCAEMKEKGADIIIALSHSGIGVCQETDGHGKRLGPTGRDGRHRRHPDRAQPPGFPLRRGTPILRRRR